MSHKETIEEIKKIDWKSKDPVSIIKASITTSMEFGGSLRMGIRAFPDSQPLKKLAEGELMTNNLQFGDYCGIGDHYDFLCHFAKKYPVFSIWPKTRMLDAENNYNKFFHRRSDRERMMTVISREIELPEIFAKILAAHDWNGLDFGFFRYYLERHVQLDSKEGGHADLVKSFSLEPEILERFWRVRLEYYQGFLQPLGSQTP